MLSHCDLCSFGVFTVCGAVCMWLSEWKKCVAAPLCLQLYFSQGTYLGISRGLGYSLSVCFIFLKLRVFYLSVILFKLKLIAPIIHRNFLSSFYLFIYIYFTVFRRECCTVQAVLRGSGGILDDIWKAVQCQNLRIQCYSYYVLPGTTRATLINGLQVYTEKV